MLAVENIAVVEVAEMIYNIKIILVQVYVCVMSADAPVLIVMDNQSCGMLSTT